MKFFLHKSRPYCLIFIAALSLQGIKGHATSGYDLWLGYPKIVEEAVAERYRGQFDTVFLSETSETTSIIAQEVSRAFGGMLELQVSISGKWRNQGLLIARIDQLPVDVETSPDLGTEGFQIIQLVADGGSSIVLTANTDIGLLYGTFHLIRLMQQHYDFQDFACIEKPRLQHRLLNHWDNLDRTVERGYAGFSLWDWHRLPDYLDPRYQDYARANASIGINGAVLTNVNSNAWVLTDDYIKKVQALADVFRPYGIKVYLTARFSAPVEIGGLETADPLDEAVIAWWNKKVEAIYELIPDFGGFLVKANSEGQPGPQDYGRSHAEGANMMAKALQPYGGIVMWRAFVYSDEVPVDRAKQAYDEFKPLDGAFAENVMLQVKNGPIDFQPREPFHPLFGAMPQTPLMMEFQITQEYLGQATQLVYLAPMFKEVLETDTYQLGEGSTVARVVDGSLHNYSITGMAGVSNIGNDLNWTGHPIAQSNWYAYGRLCWEPSLASELMAEEWITSTFGNDKEVIDTLTSIMMQSWEACVHYMTPLGLNHLMGTRHHYGPAPWVDDLAREDWNPYYFHKADSNGLGFDRSASGSHAAEQYAPELEAIYGDLDAVPEKFLLWFHHVAWDRELSSGRSLWEELAFKYQDGIDTVRKMKAGWSRLNGKIDDSIFQQVSMLMEIQEKEAIWWKDACMLYFQTFSKKEWPDFLESPQNSLRDYQELKFPYAPGIRPRWGIFH